MTISNIIFAQNISKEIHGDTTIRYQNKLIKDLDLKDFKVAQDNFNFRFWDQGQIVELTKNDSTLTGQIINYIYWTHNSKSKTLFQKLILDSNSCINLIDIISNSSLFSLATDKSIPGWQQGFDGNTYSFEYADKSDYTFKTYWTPSVQDSLKEALEILDIVQRITDTLELSKRYKSFKETLPQKGCYNSGGMSVTCYVSNNIGIGYFGSLKLPIGYSVSLNLDHIGKFHTGVGLYVIHQIDKKSQYNFSFGINKQDLFIHKHDRYDVLSYNFRKTRITGISDKYILNHIISYGLPIKNDFTLGGGLDYLETDQNYFGSLLFINKWFPRPLMSIETMTTYIKDQFNYKIGLSKHFFSKKQSFIYHWSVSILNEKFLNYNDFYFSIGLNF
jgi:hypothetical protein